MFIFSFTYSFHSFFMKKVNLFGLMALLSLQFGALAQTITTSVAPTTSVVSANPLMELRQLRPSYQLVQMGTDLNGSPSFWNQPFFKSDLSFYRGPLELPLSSQRIHQWNLNSGSDFTFSYRLGTNSFVTPLTINSTGTRLRGELALTNLSNAITFRVTPLGDMTANSATIRAALTAGSATVNGNANVVGTLTASSAIVNGNLKTQSITGSDNRGVFVINNPANTSFPAIEMYNNNSTSQKGSINFVSDATNGSEGAFNFVRYTAPNAWTNSMEIDGGGNMTVYGEFVIRNTDLSKQFKVDRTGAVRARRVQVDLATIPDYVFKPDYKLMPLDDLKTFITKNNHLPNVPSEQEYKERGNIDLSELNLKLLEKVEELTLYVLQLQDRINSLESQIKK
jgi:hypothetical protein